MTQINSQDFQIILTDRNNREIKSLSIQNWFEYEYPDLILYNNKAFMFHGNRYGYSGIRNGVILRFHKEVTGVEFDLLEQYIQGRAILKSKY